MSKSKTQIPNKFIACVTVINFAFFIFFLSAIPDLKSSFDTTIDIIFRKIVHATEFGILAYLIYILFSNYRISLKKSIFYALIFALIYALTDEYHQSFVPGREMSLIDFLIDSTGIIMVSVLLRFKIKNRKIK